MTARTSSSRTTTDGSATQQLGDLVPAKAVGGLVLLGTGIAIVASSLIPGAGEYLLLAIGLLCLAAFATTREYGYAVATGIVGGMGVGVLLTGVWADPYDGVAFLVALAGGFATTWLLGFLASPRVTHPWPLIPAILFAATAATVATEATVFVDLFVIGAVAALIAGGLKTIRDARSVA